MNRDHKVTLEINGGIDPSKPVRSYLTGKVEFDIREYGSLQAKKDPSHNRQGSLVVKVGIPKENIKPSALPMLVGLLRKAFSVQSKSSLIPASLFQLLKEDHLRVTVEEAPVSVDLVFSTSGPLEKAIDYFLGNLLTKKEFSVDQSQRIDFGLHSQTPLRKGLIDYCLVDNTDILFSSLLANSEFNLHAQVSSETASLLDSLVEATLGSGIFPLFTLAQECDLEISVDLTRTPDHSQILGHPPTIGSKFHRILESLVRNLVDYFQQLSAEEVKTLAKFVGFLSNESQALRPLTLVVEMRGLGKMDLWLTPDGGSELAEFIIYHPRLSEPVLVKKFKENFLAKINNEQGRRASK